MSKKKEIAKRWLLISGLLLCFGGWFAHFGDKSWFELVERPDRIAPLITSIAALLSRHFVGKALND